MNYYECELNFLRDVLKKCRVNTVMLSPHDTVESVMDSRIGAIIGDLGDSSLTVSKAVGRIEDATVYKISNVLKLHYVFMRLPILSEKNILLIGPYLSEQLSSKEILEIGESLGLNTNMQKLLKQYYMSVPVISGETQAYALISTFCEHIWQNDSFATVEIDEKSFLSHASSIHVGNFDDTLANMEMMEMRYSFENELIRAVSLGQLHKESILVSAFDDRMFEKRLQDPVRNSKNYCIIMNTLLRKAAEQGGVHPIYIDRVSSKFAAKIELTHDTKNISELMREMFSSYCRLVRNHSTKQYSPIVKKTVLIIDSDISAELSLNALAKMQGISSGYLATLFKKETGKTVSEYIRERRINRAVHLLNTTNLQIQTVAMHCGIMDVQYFSKIFKRHMGKTPKEYRDTVRR